MRNLKPAWWRLYALLPLGALLLVGVELAAPSVGWRAFTECLVSLAIRRQSPNGKEGLVVNPTRDDHILPGDILIVIGHEDDLAKLRD